MMGLYYNYNQVYPVLKSSSSFLNKLHLLSVIGSIISFNNNRQYKHSHTHDLLL